MEQKGKARVKKEVWVTVSGQDVLGKPFRLNTCTLDVSSHGLRLSRIPTLKGAGEILEVQLQGRHAPCRVAWVGEPGTPRQGHIGLHCQQEQPLFTEAGDTVPARVLHPYLWVGAVIVVIVAVGLGGYHLAGRYPASQPTPTRTEPSRPPTPSPAPVEPQPPRPRQAGFVVQVGAFENSQAAEALARKLSSAYQRDVLVSPAHVGGQTLYRVGLSVSGKEQAEELAQRIRTEQSLDTLVVPSR